MTKKTIEIEIPDGKIERISRDKDTILIKFEDIDICESVKNVEIVRKIARGSYPEIYTKWKEAKSGSYEENLYMYRMVVAVLTNNEKNYLTTGETYTPYVIFRNFRESDINNININIVGIIKSKGRKFTVIGGYAYYNSPAGLGHFNASPGVSLSLPSFDFRSVSSRKVAEHISKYFGRLLFDLTYGEANCDYEWID